MDDVAAAYLPGPTIVVVVEIRVEEVAAAASDAAQSAAAAVTQSLAMCWAHRAAVNTAAAYSASALE